MGASRPSDRDQPGPEPGPEQPSSATSGGLGSIPSKGTDVVETTSVCMGASRPSDQWGPEPGPEQPSATSGGLGSIPSKGTGVVKTTSVCRAEIVRVLREGPAAGRQAVQSDCPETDTKLRDMYLDQSRSWVERMVRSRTG